MRSLRSLTLLLLIPACADVENPDEHDHDHDHGLVTTIELVFTPDGGGEALSFLWADPQDDGDPSIDTVVLSEGSYALDVRFTNELAEPPEDVTAEVAEEGEEHQVFVTGSGVQSEATGANPAALLDLAYADSDANGLPLGLTHDAVTVQTGTGEIVVTLRHLPEQDGSAIKTAGLAEAVAAGGFESIGGDTDVSVVFPLDVQ